MNAIDRAGEIRTGEELDPNTIDRYLKSKLDGLTGDVVIKQFPSGASNLTYLIQYPDCEFILRRPPSGHKDKSAHDMGREYRVMSLLKQDYSYVPSMVVYCDDEAVIGCPFYVMERLKGVILRQDFPKEFELTVEETRQLCLNLIDRLVDLHQVDYEKAGLSDLGRPDGYVQRQIDGWSRRLELAKTEDLPDFGRVVTWLSQHNPGESGMCLIHNDYRFDNVVLDVENPLDIVGVLDWEMCTLGDPLMDLGNSLSYWVEANDPPMFQMLRMQPTHRPGMLTRQEVVDYYCQKADFKIDSFDFYLVYGNFRLAVVMQQLYYRFKQGQTKDMRFAALMPVIELFKGRCEELMENHV